MTKGRPLPGSASAIGLRIILREIRSWRRIADGRMQLIDLIVFRFHALRDRGASSAQRLLYGGLVEFFFHNDEIGDQFRVLANEGGLQLLRLLGCHVLNDNPSTSDVDLFHRGDQILIALERSALIKSAVVDLKMHTIFGVLVIGDVFDQTLGAARAVPVGTRLAEVHTAFSSHLFTPFSFVAVHRAITGGPTKTVSVGEDMFRFSGRLVVPHRVAFHRLIGRTLGGLVAPIGAEGDAFRHRGIVTGETGRTSS